MNNTTDLLCENTASEELTRQLKEKNPHDQLTAAAGEIAIATFRQWQGTLQLTTEQEDKLCFYMAQVISTNPTLIAMANQNSEMKCDLEQYFLHNGTIPVRQRDEIIKERDTIQTKCTELQNKLEACASVITNREDSMDKLTDRIAELENGLNKIAHIDDLTIRGRDDGPELCRRLRNAVSIAEQFNPTTKP